MSFGTTLRAFRLGYRFSHKHGCFVRMSDAEPGTYRVELAPEDCIPSKTGSIEYRCWWDDGVTALDLCKPLKAVRGVKRPITFYVNDGGEFVR